MVLLVRPKILFFRDLILMEVSELNDIVCFIQRPAAKGPSVIINSVWSNPSLLNCRQLYMDRK
jgi:hypothetical protein